MKQFIQDGIVIAVAQSGEKIKDNLYLINGMKMIKPEGLDIVSIEGAVVGDQIIDGEIFVPEEKQKERNLESFGLEVTDEQLKNIRLLEPDFAEKQVKLIKELKQTAEQLDTKYDGDELAKIIDFLGLPKSLKKKKQIEQAEEIIKHNVFQ